MIVVDLLSNFPQHLSVTKSRDGDISSRCAKSFATNIPERPISLKNPPHFCEVPILPKALQSINALESAFRPRKKCSEIDILWIELSKPFGSTTG